MQGIIYGRVSTEEQSKNGLSLPYQKESCLKFAKANDITIKQENIFLETYSGAFFDRPQLTKIFKYIEDNKINCVIILRRDRIARDVYVYNKIIKIFESFGVKIFYSEENLTGEESIDKFMGNTLIGFAEYEKSMIAKRTKSGKEQKLKMGKWVTPAPYGYIKNSIDELELYKSEVKVIKTIVDLYLNKQKTLGQITEFLNKNKILPPSMSLKGSKTQKASLKARKNSSGYWVISAVGRILENVDRYYLGEAKIFGTKYKKIGNKSIVVHKRSEDKIIKVKIPKIFDEQIARKLREKRRLNQAHSSKKHFRTYLLKGKLFCNCQPDLRSFTGYYNNNKNLVNYRCTMHRKGNTSPERRCNNNISGKKIEGVIIGVLRDFFLDYEKFYYEYCSNKPLNPEEVNIIDQYRYEIYKLEEKKNRAMDLYLDGTMDKNKLNDINKECDKKIVIFNDKIHAEYELVYNEYMQGLLNTQVPAYVKKLQKYALEFFDNANYEELRKVVELMVDKIIVPKDKKGTIRIILNIAPGIFEIDKYLDNKTGGYVLKKFDSDKNDTRYFQVEFSDYYKSDNSKDTDGGDYKFINLIKKTLGQFPKSDHLGETVQIDFNWSIFILY